MTATRALVTGASGGIGRAVATELVRRGAAVMLVGRDPAVLAAIAAALGGRSDRVEFVAADLTSPAGRRELRARAVAWGGVGLNTLVNNAGTGDFGLFEATTDAALEQLFAINTLAPMQLCRDLLPHLRRQPAAAICNVGSVFGSLGYPGFVAYSATKFALRGFTEALARELADTKVRVHYLAPRATRTGMNSSAVERMNAELKVTMDSPESVAVAVCDMLERRRRHAVVGWPEKLFVRINALFPAVVDSSVSKQLHVIRRHAQQAAGDKAAAAAGRPAPASVLNVAAAQGLSLTAAPSAPLPSSPQEKLT